MYLKDHVLNRCQGSVPHVLILCTVAPGFWPRNHPVQPSSYHFTGKSQMCLQKLRPGFNFSILAKDISTSPEHQQSLCFSVRHQMCHLSQARPTYLLLFVEICLWRKKEEHRFCSSLCFSLCPVPSTHNGRNRLVKWFPWPVCLETSQITFLHEQQWPCDSLMVNHSMLLQQ